MAIAGYNSYSSYTGYDRSLSTAFSVENAIFDFGREQVAVVTCFG